MGEVLKTEISRPQYQLCKNLYTEESVQESLVVKIFLGDSAAWLCL